MHDQGGDDAKLFLSKKQLRFGGANRKWRLAVYLFSSRKQIFFDCANCHLQLAQSPRGCKAGPEKESTRSFFP
jgi:hypothetical protein